MYVQQVLIDSACVLADLAYTFLSAECTPIEGPDTPVWLNILAQVSLAITTFFLVEIPLSVWAIGLQNYNPFGPVPHAALHFFDAIVIVTTFVLEVVLRGRERELASLLIILRLWRLVKLVQGECAIPNGFSPREACGRRRVGGEFRATQMEREPRNISYHLRSIFLYKCQ